MWFYNFKIPEYQYLGPKMYMLKDNNSPVDEQPNIKPNLSFRTIINLVATCYKKCYN